MNSRAPYWIAAGLFLLALILVYLLYKSGESSALAEYQRDQLRSEIEEIASKRDSLIRISRLREDSLLVMGARNDSLTLVVANLRKGVRDAERTAARATRPNFYFPGTDSALLAAVDSVLRSRQRAE